MAITKQQETSTSQSKPVTASRYGQQTPIDTSLWQQFWQQLE
jgi:hypothetical protein